MLLDTLPIIVTGLLYVLQCIAPSP